MPGSGDVQARLAWTSGSAGKTSERAHIPGDYPERVWAWAAQTRRGLPTHVQRYQFVVEFECDGWWCGDLPMLFNFLNAN